MLRCPICNSDFLKEENIEVNGTSQKELLCLDCKYQFGEHAAIREDLKEPTYNVLGEWGCID